MKEWIVGRNPVFEVLEAGRRDCFRLLVATGVDEKGKLTEIMRKAAARRVALERVPRQRLDSLGENHQGVALEASGYSYSDLQDIFDRQQERQEPLLVLVLVRSVRFNEELRKLLYFTSSLLILLGIFSMRWNVVIGGQLYSKSLRGLMAYKMGITGIASSSRASASRKQR